ncbi:endoplasmic reticulum-Golgi intermediate compartment family protein [Skeletonema marinoi]|uniref:Endoplasmic reticulum-Golgi intermediate compartment family protein n=1 Tax=Skeletonema marinoi TaxID=267567 RepID=A0AAD9DIZ6_9STRA|nr:endoplasmic reticulum-Golgi intermediate compartment family protein [Skeletonema marinoi]
MKQSYTDYFRSIDTHSPISSEFRVRTLSGALISIFTLVLTIYLIGSEYTYNLTPTFLDHVHVMPQSPDGLEVEFDITFQHIPCALLATDANDPTGQSQSFHIDKNHRVWKHRLDKNGNTAAKESKDDSTDAAQQQQQKQGEELEKPMMKKIDECCNTCDDVKRAYRRKSWHVPDISKITQCAHMLRASNEEGEGCNVHGKIALSTGGGNLHFAPDRQWEKEGADKVQNPLGGLFLDLNSIIEMFNDAYEQFNVSHTVNKLTFGRSMPDEVRNSLNLTSQLDGVSRTVADGYGMFQYYLQVIPTKYQFLNGTSIETFQYSVTEHTRHVDPGSNRGLPGVFFFYEVSALHVEFEEYVRGYSHFFTGVCAAVGGAFTVMGMLDRKMFDLKSANARTVGGGVLG